MSANGSRIYLNQLRFQQRLDAPAGFTSDTTYNASLEARQLSRKYQIHEDRILSCLLSAVSEFAYADDRDGFPLSIRKRTHGESIFHAICRAQDAALSCLRWERRCGRGTVSLVLMDLFGGSDAARIASALFALAVLPPLREEPLAVDDERVLDVIVAPLLHYVSQKKPAFSQREKIAFVKDALSKRWPASSGSIADAVDRQMSAFGHAHGYFGDPS